MGRFKMAKKESTFLNMVLTLLIITFVASAALGYIYELTKGPIAASKLAKQNNAIKQVVPEFDNEPIKEEYKMAVDGDTISFFPARKNGELVGTAVSTFTNKGFSGNIKIMVGFLPDGSIFNYSVLEHKETPGLGDKMGTWFNDKNRPKSCILGLSPEVNNLTVSKDKGEVDAITAATISSRAFLDAIDRAYKAYKEGGKK
ncbi:MAG TPA: RnfABCDGE type electron transport complex subunit G [Bacteroidales bacterium]|nr:RnfABCDGE type electron transport complex subunit G [Bacteroidales bacterium]